MYILCVGLGGPDHMLLTAKGPSEQLLPAWAQLSEAVGGRHYRERKQLWPVGIGQEVEGSNPTVDRGFYLDISVKWTRYKLF